MSRTKARKTDQDLPFLHLRKLRGIATGPVKAERSEPQGSLDGWRDAKSCRWKEWQVGLVRQDLFIRRISLPRIHSHCL